MADTSNRGFASMDPDEAHEIQSEGGKASAANQDMSELGRKGGKSQGKHNNPGNFANDREKASEAGRIGGEHSHSGGRSD